MELKEIRFWEHEFSKLERELKRKGFVSTGESYEEPSTDGVNTFYDFRYEKETGGLPEVAEITILGIAENPDTSFDDLALGSFSEIENMYITYL